MIEFKDKVFYLIVVLSYFLSLYLIKKTKNSTYPFFKAQNHLLPATIIIFLLYFFKIDKNSILETKYWNGYKYDYVIIFLLIIMIINLFLLFKSQKWFIYGLYFISITLCIYYVNNLIQFPNSEFDSYHFLFTLNELAASKAGWIPLINYKTQYSNVLGFFLLLLPSNQIVGLYLFVMFLNILTFILLFLIIKVLTSKNAFLFFSLTLPTIFLRGSNPQESVGSIFTFPGTFPLRILPILVIGLTLYFILKLNDNIYFTHKIFIFLTFIIVFLNNIETGLVSILSFFSVYLLIDFKRVKIRFLAEFIFYLVSTISLCIYVSQAFFQDNFINNLTFFVTRFGGGFYSIPMDEFGFVNFLIIVSILSSSVAYFNILNNFKNNSHQDKIILYFNFVILFSLPYYINRSSYTGQLQWIYILSVFNLIYIVSSLIDAKFLFIKPRLSLFICSIFISILIFPISHSPSFFSNLNRISKSNFNLSEINSLIISTENLVKINNIEVTDIGVVTNLGNLTSLISNFQSILAQNNVDDMVPDFVNNNNSNNEKTCSQIRKSKYKYIIIEKYRGIYSDYQNSFIISKICNFNLTNIQSLDNEDKYYLAKITYPNS